MYCVLQFAKVTLHFTILTFVTLLTRHRQCCLVTSCVSDDKILIKLIQEDIIFMRKEVA